MVLRKHELERKLGEESRLIDSGVLRDDNPLDQSPEFEEFLFACRRGDLRRCQKLINQGVNINGKDRFDYTPLIVASLCGHYDLVRLLLESGALAERNTFQGERCIYNALNDRIRNLLLQYDFSKTSDPYLYWSSHLAGLLTRAAPPTSDISIVAAGGQRRFHLHKFILAARTPYFAARLTARPGVAAWNGLAAVPAEALLIILRHVYLAELPRDLVPPGSPPGLEDRVARALDRVARELGLPHLWEAFVDSAGDARLARQRFRDEEERALEQMGRFFRAHVLGAKMVLDPASVPDVRYGRDNAAFADVLLRTDEPAPAQPPPANRPGSAPVRKMATTTTATLYPAHKAMLIRSPYFERMFSGDYVEAQSSAHLHVVRVDCSPAVLELVLGYLYTESVACPLEHALDLLYAADMLLLDGLKAKAAVAISTLGSGGDAAAEPVNIYDVVHAAWDLGVRRLEEFAARYLAARLDETDSIKLLDDIRYYLSERFRLRFDDARLDVVLAAPDAPAPAPDAPRDGDPADDGFASDALNYQVLLGKIDAMLDSLELDA